MVRRAVGSEFMGNAHVFPGGAVDEGDRGREAASAVRWDGDPEELPWRAAALRELYEEAGLALTSPPDLEVSGGTADLYGSVVAAGGRLDARGLHWVSRWVTPEGLSRRFDTRFYVAEVTGEAAARADGVEVFDDTWTTPQHALESGDTGVWDIPFPTRHHLEMLSRYDTVGEVMEYVETITQVHSVLPTIVLGENGEYRPLMAGDPNSDQEAGQ